MVEGFEDKPEFCGLGRRRFLTLPTGPFVDQHSPAQKRKSNLHPDGVYPSGSFSSADPQEKRVSFPPAT